MGVSWLFIFVPVAAVLERIAPLAQTWVFFSACLAINPIAHLIVESTEHISVHTGDAIGGLLNATFGNAPELIIAMVALRASAIAMARKTDRPQYGSCARQLHSDRAFRRARAGARKLSCRATPPRAFLRQG